MKMHLPFYRVDPLAEADPLSRAVVHLEMLASVPEQAGEDWLLATGSGVVWQDPKTATFYLVTAWHNLAGKEPSTGHAKHSKKVLPWKVRIRGFFFDHTENLRVDGGNPDQAPAAYWTHPKGRQIDVAILPLMGVKECHCGFPLLSGGIPEQVYVAEPVFVIGYPLGLVNQAGPRHPYPIWKMGNVANDPGPDFNGEPKFLIDATTLPGMSGAPVIRRYNFAGNPGYNFLGIYVGRFVIPKKPQNGAEAFGNEPAEISSGLGWVMKPEVIYETLKVGGPSQDGAL